MNKTKKKPLLCFFCEKRPQVYVTGLCEKCHHGAMEVSQEIKSMALLTLFQTKKGIFYSKEKAEKTRQGYNDRGFPCGYEEVKKVKALKLYDHEGGSYCFLLTPLETKD